MQEPVTLSVVAPDDLTIHPVLRISLPRDQLYDDLSAGAAGAVRNRMVISRNTR
jgi:hypothetical protein